MSLDLTRQSLLNTILYFVLLATVFWGAELFDPASAVLAHEVRGGEVINMPLGRLIHDFIVAWPVVGLLISSLLVFINALLVTRIVIRNVIFLERTYMPSIVYLLISSGYYNSYLSCLPLIVSLLLMVAAEMIFKSYNDRNLSTGRYLTIGFTVGLAGMVYAPALLFVVLLPVALMMFRLPNVREWISAFAGWMLPIFFTAYGVWLAGGHFSEIVDTALEAIVTPKPMVPSVQLLTYFEWTFIGCVALLFVLSMITFFSRLRSFKLKQLKAYIFFIWVFIFTVAIITLVPCGSLYMLPVTATPLAVIIPTYFNSRKPNFVSNFIYVLMLGCAVMIHILPLLKRI